MIESCVRVMIKGMITMLVIATCIIYLFLLTSVRTLGAEPWSIYAVKCAAFNTIVIRCILEWWIYNIEVTFIVFLKPTFTVNSMLNKYWSELRNHSINDYYFIVTRQRKTSVCLIWPTPETWLMPSVTLTGSFLCLAFSIWKCRLFPSLAFRLLFLEDRREI